jgi:hypothetical protein
MVVQVCKKPLCSLHMQRDTQETPLIIFQRNKVFEMICFYKSLKLG